MRTGSTLFLQAVTVLIGIGAIALLLWEPHLEGRNAQATLLQVYFDDPFLAWAYAASIPVFVALYQTFTLLGGIGRDRVFSWTTVRRLRIIRHSAVALVAAALAAQAYFFVAIRGQDDIAGGVAMSLVLAFMSTVVAAASFVLEKTLADTLDLGAADDPARNGTGPS